MHREKTAEAASAVENVARLVTARLYPSWSEADRESVIAKVLKAWESEPPGDHTGDLGARIATAVRTTAADLAIADPAGLTSDDVSTDWDIAAAMRILGRTRAAGEHDAAWQRLQELLSAEERELLTLRHVGGFTAAEIAAKLERDAEQTTASVQAAERRLADAVAADPGLRADLSFSHPWTC